jgi:hypothetical protein
MALLGDPAQVKKLLATSGASYDANHDDRILAIQAAVSSALEDEIGRTFGDTAADTTDLYWAGRSGHLILRRPARSITSVTVGGTVTGGTMTGGTAVLNTTWTHDPVSPRTGLIYGLRLTAGGWWGDEDAYGGPTVPVQIVGDFATTDDDSEIPDDLTYVASYLIAERFKQENAGPAGFSGPDGSVVPIRDAWKDPLVVKVIGKYRIPASPAALVV